MDTDRLLLLWLDTTFSGPSRVGQGGSRAFSNSSSMSEDVDYSQLYHVQLDAAAVSVRRRGPDNNSSTGSNSNSSGLQNPMRLTTTSSLSFHCHPRDGGMEEDDERNSEMDEGQQGANEEEEEEGEREESDDNDDGRSVASRTSSASRVSFS